MDSEGYKLIQKGWRFSELGERLWASGHVRHSREYAYTIDPFKHGRVVRWAAHTTLGDDYDDRQSYPNAGMHIITVGRDMLATYINFKDEILEGIGWLMWGDAVTQEIRKDRVKGFFNALENQGTLTGLYRQFNIPENSFTDAANLNVSLPNGDRFRLKEFIAVQAARTQ